MMEIHRQLRGISSDRAVGLGPNKVLSVPDAVGLAIEEWVRAKQGVQTDLLGTTAGQSTPRLEQISVAPTGDSQGLMQFDRTADAGSFIGTCPDCGSQLEFAEGCVKCHVCGFSECG